MELSFCADYTKLRIRNCQSFHRYIPSTATTNQIRDITTTGATLSSNIGLNFSFLTLYSMIMLLKPLKYHVF